MIAEPSQAFNYYDSDLARNLDNFRLWKGFYYYLIIIGWQKSILIFSFLSPALENILFIDINLAYS